MLPPAFYRNWQTAIIAGRLEGNRQQLNEVFLKVNCVSHYLWRAVDQGGEVFESYETKRPDKKVEFEFFRKKAEAAWSPR